MVLLMSAATAAIGLLPTWHAVGVLASAGLVVLRLVQGFASGGEISTSIPFLLESAPTERWGFYGGWHTATVALGIACGIAVAGRSRRSCPPRRWRRGGGGCRSSSRCRSGPLGSTCDCGSTRRRRSPSGRHRAARSGDPG